VHFRGEFSQENVQGTEEAKKMAQLGDERSPGLSLLCSMNTKPQNENREVDDTRLL
jgi:hypothetical protein